MELHDKPQPPQKLIDFNNDLKALCAKYQYDLVAVLAAGEDGIFPRLIVKDVSPKDEGVQLNPAPATPEPTNPNPETPAEPEKPAEPQTPVDAGAANPV